jgi:hypothetical protein
LDGGAERDGFGDIIRERFLYVEVFARESGLDGHERVPVVGRADNDGVDVGLGEEFAVVVVGADVDVTLILIKFHDVFARSLKADRVEIAHGNHARERMLHDIHHVILSHASDADLGDVQTTVGGGAEEAAGGKNVRERGEAGGTEERVAQKGAARERVGFCERGHGGKL